MKRPSAIALAQLAAGALLAGCPTSDEDNGDATTPEATSNGEADTGATTATGAGADTSSASTGPGSTATDPCSLGGERILEIGHGEPPFDPLGAHPAELIAGVQGGFHILLGLRAAHVDSSDLAVARITGVVEGEELAFSAPYVELLCTEAGLEAPNVRLIFDSTPDFLDGKVVHIAVELTDAADTITSAEGEVTIAAN